MINKRVMLSLLTVTLPRELSCCIYLSNIGTFLIISPMFPKFDTARVPDKCLNSRPFRRAR